MTCDTESAKANINSCTSFVALADIVSFAAPYLGICRTFLMIIHLYAILIIIFAIDLRSYWKDMADVVEFSILKFFAALLFDIMWVPYWFRYCNIEYLGSGMLMVVGP